MSPDDNDLHRASPGDFDPTRDIRPFQVIPGGAGTSGPPAQANGAVPRGPSDTRPEVQITTDEHLVNDAALAALAASSPDLYKRGFLLVHVVRDEGRRKGPILRNEGAFRIGEVPSGRMREMLAESVRWLRFDQRAEDTVPAHPPDFTVRALLARGEWVGVRRLMGVVETPVLRPDGSILDAPGYDADTALLFLPSTAFPPVPVTPTPEQVARALDDLREVVTDFPFATPAHRAGWLAALLTVFARHAFEGPSPLFLIDANVRGAGKSMLADAISVIYTGRPMARMAPTDDDAEMRKRVTTIAMAADPLVLIDNVAGALGTPSLDGALTATTWKDRLLGTNDQREWPLTTVWFATGNNISIVGDLTRRCTHLRLESPEEQPERRKGFKHENLLAWAREERARLAVAALTILRAFCVAGRPIPRDLPAWGSFEDWSVLVRAALVWAGEADPGDTREELQATSDTDAAALADLIRGWEEVARNNGGRCTVTEAISDLQADTSGKRYEALRSAIAEMLPTKPGTFPSNKSLGKLLSRFRDRVVGGKAIVMARDRGRQGREWAVKSTTQPGRPEGTP